MQLKSFENWVDSGIARVYDVSMTVAELIKWLQENANPSLEVRVYDGTYMNWHDKISTPEIKTADPNYGTTKPYVFIPPEY